MELKQAIILAGGLGTRLRSAVPDLPKCMAPVNSKPFLSYVIDYLEKQGINDFILSLGYKHALIVDYIKKEYNSQIFQFIIEDEPLGTGGAIQLACNKRSSDNLVVTNGDTLFKANLFALANMHDEHLADCTLCLKPMNNFDRYGVVELDLNNSVKSFKEKRFYETGLINGGVYALNATAFLNADFEEKFSFEKDYLEQYFINGKFLD
jgi:D-glycero-alpha-D-manno-heptose 1-phosphate guanylyltransferase